MLARTKDTVDVQAVTDAIFAKPYNGGAPDLLIKILNNDNFAEL